MIDALAPVSNADHPCYGDGKRAFVWVDGGEGVGT